MGLIFQRQEVKTHCISGSGYLTLQALQMSDFNNKLIRASWSCLCLKSCMKFLSLGFVKFQILCCALTHIMLYWPPDGDTHSPSVRTVPFTVACRVKSVPNYKSSTSVISYCTWTKLSALLNLKTTFFYYSQWRLSTLTGLVRQSTSIAQVLDTVTLSMARAFSAWKKDKALLMSTHTCTFCYGMQDTNFKGTGWGCKESRYFPEHWPLPRSQRW